MIRVHLFFLHDVFLHVVLLQDVFLHVILLQDVFLSLVHLQDVLYMVLLQEFVVCLGDIPRSRKEVRTKGSLTSL